jgi:hypothetical protein
MAGTGFRENEAQSVELVFWMISSRIDRLSIVFKKIKGFSPVLQLIQGGDGRLRPLKKDRNR